MSYTPDNVTDCLAEARLALEKGKLVLTDLTIKFPFDGNRGDYIQKWTFEYGRITAYMDIALDYMYEASKKIERAEEIKGGVSND